MISSKAKYSLTTGDMTAVRQIVSKLFCNIQVSSFKFNSIELLLLIYSPTNSH